MTMQEAQLYDREELWGKPPEEYQLSVLRDILNVLPPDAESVLDVGCGDGFITNALPAGKRIVGLDVGPASLVHVSRETAVGSVTSLPFPTASFDCVMANDMLEHLNDEAFAEALREMQRVSARYIVVTVPFMEQFDGARTVCGSCGTTYHINHHHRAFGIRELTQLFPAPWKSAVIVLSGATVSVVEQAQRALKALFGYPSRWDAAVCPACRAQASLDAIDPAIKEGLEALSWELDVKGTVHQSDRSECIVLYERNAGAIPAALPAGKVSLSVLAKDGKRGLDTELESTDGTLFLRLKDVNSLSPGCVAMEYVDGGTLYRLPEPARLDADRFQVPLWFLPGQLSRLSASDGNLRDALLGAALLHLAREFKSFSGQTTTAVKSVAGELAGLSGVHLELVQAQAQQLKQVLDLMKKVSVLEERLAARDTGGGG